MKKPCCLPDKTASFIVILTALQPRYIEMVIVALHQLQNNIFYEILANSIFMTRVGKIFCR